jgi:putative drug exporter of the RND superfamily
MLARLATLIDRHPWGFLLVAAGCVAVSAPLGLQVRDRLKPRGFDVPGSDSTKARSFIAEASGTDPANTVLALVHLPRRYGQPQAQRAIATVERTLQEDPAVVNVLDAESAHNPALVGRHKRLAYVIAQLRPLDDKQQEEAGKRLLAAFAGSSRVTLGGNPIANHEISSTIETDLRRAELLAVPLIVLLSFFLFRGLIASLLAPLAGGLTVLVSFFLLRELASLTSLSIYALNLVTGLSIGLSIDWSLLLLSRYREERAREDDLRLALRRALEHAGHTIIFSALIVAGSMATLLIFPLRFLRSMGYGGVIASAVAAASALIVLPAVLRVLGDRIDGLALPAWRDPQRLARPAGRWRAIGRLTTGHPLPIAAVTLVLLVAVATPLYRIQWTTVDASSLPSSAQAHRTDRTINRSHEFVPNSGTPFYLALRTTSSAGRVQAASLADNVRDFPGVRAVARPVQLSHDAWQINVVSQWPPYSAPTQRLVEQLRTLNTGPRFLIGGDAAAFHDERTAIGDRLPLAIAVLAALTFVILLMLTRSVVAPLLALAMNALTLGAAFGALILIFQDGRFQSLLQYESADALDLTIPLVLAALVFAVSTDYGVFLLSRVREARQRGTPDQAAIGSSVATTGRIVTSAALLFAVSIGIFGTSNIIVLKILGIGTALAVLLDAVLVRCLLLPATLTLLGRHAWWLSHSVQRPASSADERPRSRRSG